MYIREQFYFLCIWLMKCCIFWFWTISNQKQIDRYKNFTQASKQEVILFYCLYCFGRFRFVSIWFRFILEGFVSFRFLFRFVSIGFVSFRKVLFRFGRFRFVSVDFVSFHFVSFLFRWLSHFTGTRTDAGIFKPCRYQ